MMRRTVEGNEVKWVVYCHICETKFPYTPKTRAKLDMLLYQEGWSMGARPKCPNCRGHTKNGLTRQQMLNLNTKGHL